MMFHLDPSVEMTGGPWYTDNELDTEFIKLLCRACLQFIKDRVWATSFHYHDAITHRSSEFSSRSQDGG